MDQEEANSSPSDEEEVIQINNFDSYCDYEDSSDTVVGSGSTLGTDSSTESSSENNDSLDVNTGNRSGSSTSLDSSESEDEDPLTRNCLIQILSEKKNQDGFKDFDLVWLTQDSSLDLKKTYASREPYSFVQDVQTTWEWSLYDSLSTVYVNAGAPLAQVRSLDDQNSIRNKWDDVAKFTLDCHLYRPVYGPRDFLKVLLQVRKQAACNVKRHRTFWKFGELPFKTRTLPELEYYYRVMARGEPMLSVNANLVCSTRNISLEQDRYEQAVILLQNEDVIGAQKFIKRGCPVSLRGPLWSLVLGVFKTAESMESYYRLKMLVIEVDLVVDKLSLIDLHEIAENDGQYFPHVDRIQQVMLLFSRDTDLIEVFKDSIANPTHACIGGAVGKAEDVVVYPPSGIIPFYGFCMFVAPVCYLFDDLGDLYPLFRAVYKRHFFRLHEVSSHPQGILCLCVLFERLLEKHEPKLWAHFRTINDNPLRPAFRWLLRAFSGHLSVTQLLNLWDIIVAYDSLEVLPLLAVSIMSLRKENLCSTQNRDDVDDVLVDLSSISVVELIQFTLIQMSTNRLRPRNPATSPCANSANNSNSTNYASTSKSTKYANSANSANYANSANTANTASSANSSQEKGVGEA